MPEEQKQGTQGTEKEGAEGTSQVSVEDSQKSINSQAKELSWVKDLMSKAAELDKFKTAQEEASKMAEQEQLKAAGNYEAALEVEKGRYKELEAKYQRETKELTLKAEMASAGLIDSRAIKLFIDDFNEKNESVSDFVARIKADEKNSIYFSNSKRMPLEPAPRSGGGIPDSFDPTIAQEWLDSSDQKKRERAIKYYREVYAKGANGVR